MLVAALGMVIASGTYAEDMMDKSATAISEGVVMPMAKSLHLH